MTTEVNNTEDIIFPFDKYDMVRITDHIARDYYCALHLAGHKIELEWNGGGDSGDVWINLDDQRVDLPWEEHKQSFQERIHQHVIHEMYDHLDYGSWAGEFSSCGTADFVHDGDFIGFRGTDYYSEEEAHYGTVDAEWIVPAAWLTEEMGEVHIDISDGYDGHPPEVSLYATAKGTHKLVAFPAEFTAEISAFETEVAGRISDKMCEWNACNVYENNSFLISDHSQDLTIKVETIQYFTMEETEKEMQIDLFQIED